MSTVTHSTPRSSAPATARLWLLPAFLLLIIGGLTLTRLVFEWQFPDWLWLGRPLPALLVALGVAALVAVVGYRVWRTPGGVLALLPLALNFIYLVQPGVDLAFSRALFGGSLWLVGVLLVWRAFPDTMDVRWRWMGPLLIVLALLPVYWLTMSHAVGEADTFEFQVVAPQLGIAHPTGYPLYLVLGKLFSLLPVGTTAWRINLASAVYSIVAAVIIYWLARRLTEQPPAAMVGAVAWGLAPVVWGQAIVAEVYTLHALIVAVALWLMTLLTLTDGRPDALRQQRLALALAFTIGLGLTNHLTTVFLIPPALLVAVYQLMDRRQVGNGIKRIDWRFFGLLVAAFCLPLLLYFYLPLRWQAVNGEPMGAARFVEWVVGGRFQGALKWMAWVRDPARYGIVGRLIYDNWGWFYLAWAALGVVYLWLKQRRIALVLLVAAVGFAFYALNYYVPDLAVFLLPVHVVIAVSLAAGVAGAIAWLSRLSWTVRLPTGVVAGLLFLVAAGPLVWRTADLWVTLDQSARDGGEAWARGVMSRPLAPGGAILADSEKIAPLYYLQQNEGLRPDLDIMVLPDEAAYRAELDRRTAAGQRVYLARFLPGLASAYHLRSVGPLVQADPQPALELPSDVLPVDVDFGPVRLRGLTAEPVSAEDTAAAGVTLYWQQARPLAEGEELPVIFVRWNSDRHNPETTPIAGQHAVGNTYPINAWRPGEVVADYRALPVPVLDCPDGDAGCALDVQIALAPRFANPDMLAWQTVTGLLVRPPLGRVGEAQRAQIGPFLLNGAVFPEQVRPATTISVRLSGWGDGTVPMLSLRSAEQTAAADEPLPTIRVDATGPSRQVVVTLSADVDPGDYLLWAEDPHGAGAVCGWLAPLTSGCALGDVVVSGAPLPDGATNFADQVALLDIDIPQTELQPGGQLPLTITWQGLASMADDYTVFVQVLDVQDRLVGQVDSWPVQGTFPTSQWTPGEMVRDPYLVQLSNDLLPGDYKLNVGLYLLGTLQRLSVVDASGAAVNDKLEVGGLAVMP